MRYPMRLQLNLGEQDYRTLRLLAEDTGITMADAARYYLLKGMHAAMRGNERRRVRERVAQRAVEAVRLEILKGE